MTHFKQRLEDYTESEFLEFLEQMSKNPYNLKGKEYGAYVDKFVVHFENITEHPRKSDVLFYPEPGQEDSPQGILKEVKEWRAANGKSGFKPDIP